MSTNDKKLNQKTIAQSAGLRAGVYGLLAGVMGNLPDKRLIFMIKGDELIGLFRRIDNTRFQDYHEAIDLIQAYGTEIEDRPEEEVLQELAVDRTRIMRGTGPRELKPPYEGLYRKNGKADQSIRQLKEFYRTAGVHPDDNVNESPDFLGIELDFMRHLCIREQHQWSTNQDALQTFKLEKAFLGNHLGSWVCTYCSLVLQYAFTGFYKGIGAFLGAFIKMDTGYLNEMIGKPSNSQKL